MLKKTMDYSFMDCDGYAISWTQSLSFEVFQISSTATQKGKESLYGEEN
jgi:hypothetical protein